MWQLHSRARQFNECSGPALDWKIGVEVFHLATVVTHIQWILEALSMRIKWLRNRAIHFQLVEFKERPELCLHKYAKTHSGMQCQTSLVSQCQTNYTSYCFYELFLIGSPSLAQCIACYKMCNGISFKVYCGSFCTRSKVRLAVKYSVVTFKLFPVKLLRRKRQTILQSRQAARIHTPNGIYRVVA